MCAYGLTTVTYADLVGHWRMGEGATWDGYQWLVPDLQPDPADGTSIGLIDTDRVDGLTLLGETAPHYGLNLHDGAYISIGNPAKLDITGDLTVTAWVKPSSLTGFGPIIGKGDYQYMLRRGDSSFHFFTYDGGWHQVNADVGAVIGEWYFVAGRVNTATTTVSIWVNATGYGTATGGITSDAAAVEIGRNSSVTDRLFNGVIDDVRVYNHALTDAELLALYYSRAILQQPVVTPATTVFEGEAVTMTVVASGSAPTYQWFKGTTPLPGQTAATLSIASATLGDTGTYYVEVTNEAGTATSDTVALTVQAASAPVITQDPVGCTRYVGGYCTFTATAQGTPPLTYQWKKDGTVIAGQTSPSLALTDITSADAGTYVLEVSNQFGTKASAGALLKILVPTAGSFAERVIAHNPVAYWRLNETEGTTAFDYVGGYDGTHTPGVLLGNPGPQPTDFPGLETSNACAAYDDQQQAGTEIAASLMNNRAAFTMIGWIKMPSIPNGRFALFGQNDVAEFGFHGAVLGIWTPGGGFASFDPLVNIVLDEWMMIAATGDGSVLNLYLNGDLLASVAGVTSNYGESTDPFRIGFATLDSTGNYLWGDIDEVALFDHALSQNDLNALYAIAGGVVPPKITSAPTDIEAYPGTDIQMSVQATGTLPLEYQWYKNNVPLADGGNITGAKTAQLWIAGVSATDEAQYKVTVSNPAGPVSSDPVTLKQVTPRAGSYEEMVVGLNPVAYWSLNEAAGSTLAFDRVSGYNALHDYYAYAGEVGPQPPLLPGMETDNLCTRYDGDQDSETTTAASLMSKRAAFTIAGWVYPETMPQITITGASDRVGLFGQNDVAEFGFHGQNNLGIWSPTGGYVAINVAELMFPNEWYFIVATGDGFGMKLYLNGKIVASGGNAAVDYGTSGYPFRIGYGVLDTGSNWFDGSIDEVAVWDRALTPSEVVTLYEKGTAVHEPPIVVVQPASGTLFEGRTATLSVVEAGALPMSYQWRKGGVPLANGGNISGATSQQLVIAGLTPADAGDYDVVVSNAGGTVTSEIATLGVTPLAGTYAQAVADLDPIGYWPLDEPTGGLIVSDTWNGRHGSYAAAAIAGQPGVVLPGFKPGNTALRTTAGLDNAHADLPGLGFNNNTATFLCWIKPEGAQGGFRGLIFLRSGGPVSGLHFGNGMELRYSWADAANTWGWNSGLLVPDGQWALAAVVVEPTRATIYLGANGTLQSAVNTVNHANQNFNNSPTRIGVDPTSVNRHFNGWIDEVAIWNRALSSAEITTLFQAGMGGDLEITIAREGSNVTISWPAGTLQSASEINGTWTDVTSVSPYTTTVTEPKAMFFRARNP